MAGPGRVLGSAWGSSFTSQTLGSPCSSGLPRLRLCIEQVRNIGFQRGEVREAGEAEALGEDPVGAMSPIGIHQTPNLSAGPGLYQSMRVGKEQIAESKTTRIS